MFQILQKYVDYENRPWNMNNNNKGIDLYQISWAWLSKEL